MADTELKGKEEKLVGSLGPEFDESEMKKKRNKRLIVFSAIAIIIIAIVITLVLVLKKSDDEKQTDEPPPSETDGPSSEETDEPPSSETDGPPSSDKGTDKESDIEPDLKPEIIMTDSDFIKPKSTTKSFELVELEGSKYKFILVHDPKSVNAGIEFRTKFGFDTEVLDGLAHYAEHVFFEGTKASDELYIFNLIGQFNEFLNAYTWEEETVFQILGSNLTFDETLNVVSNFIEKPLLNETQFTLEINAVNSEYDTYNYTYEIALAIMRDNSNPEHAFSQTITGHTGNNITLRNVTSEKMKDILKNYFLTIFRPENCVFLIYSSSDFEDMANRAQKYFNFKLEEPTEEFKNLINKKIEALDNPIFLDGQLGKIAIYNNLRETPLLLFNFEFSQKEAYAEIINLLYYLLSNYHEGSLQNYLTMKNYISSFEYSVIGYYKNCEIISLAMSLTEEGIKNIDNIIKAFFAYINTIKNEPEENLEKILNNIKSIENKKFQFKEDKKAVFPDDIDTLVRNFYFFGEEKILGAPVNELYSLNRTKQILEELSPNKTFITIDTNYPIDSEFLIPSTEIKYIISYKVPYKINSIPEELITNLTEITSVDEYVFKIREINDNYSKLENMTDIPCYQKESNQCDKYNETDINSKEQTEPYIIDNSENILSLMKIDRTFGIPFIKGYIELELDEQIKKYLESEENKAILYLINLSIISKYYESYLYEGGSNVDFQFSNSDNYKIQIFFSTYNDLLNTVIDYIINALKEPIDEYTFNNLKEKYYASLASNINSPAVDFRNEMINIFRRFITIDTYNFAEFPKELIESVKYNNFIDMFNNIMKISKIKYLTYGDISEELANSTTYKLSEMINTEDLIFKLNKIKIPIIPDNSSIYYILKSSDIYQRQGRTLVLYEFDESLRKKMDIFSYCAYDYIFDYIRTKRGSGYAVKTFIQKILNKSYLIIYVLGKIYSPEKMDRLVNEAIKASFTFKDCRVDSILKHLKNRDNIKGYIEDKFENLLFYLDPINHFYKEEINEDDEKMTYESIVDDLQEVFVSKVRRIGILCHRGDESDEQYEKEKNELDEFYYFNNNITNEYTEDIKYLDKYLNDSLF